MELGFNPTQWARMHRWDKRYWQYALALRNHYQAEAQEQAIEKAKMQAKKPKVKAR